MSCGPLLVVGDRVDAEADHLRPALGKLRLEVGDCAEFRGADRREVLRVREQHSPAIADPLMEVDGALGRFGGEVGSYIVDAE